MSRYEIYTCHNCKQPIGAKEPMEHKLENGERITLHVVCPPLDATPENVPYAGEEHDR